MDNNRINHTFLSGQKRFEVEEDGNYIVLRARRSVWGHLINAAYIGMCAKHKQGKPFGPAVTDMIFQLRKKNNTLHSYPLKRKQ